MSDFSWFGPIQPRNQCSVCISFLCAVVVVLVVSVIILIHFVVVIFSSRIYAQQMFSALFTGVLNTIVCVCRRGVRGDFPAGLQLALVSSVRDSFGRGKCFPIFYTGLMCMCCVCVRTHMHTHCMWGTRKWAQVSEQDTWRARKKSRCTVAIAYVSYHTVYEVHMYIYMLGYR